MRIVYGVFGYGRGHATRAQVVLPELMRQHEVLLLAGDDAYDALSPEYPVVRIPTLAYIYKPDGTQSVYGTFKRNASVVSDALFHGTRFRQIRDVVREFKPHLAIADAEPFTHTTCSALKIPRISLDHFGVMVYCKPPVPWHDRVRLLRDQLTYRSLMGTPERVIVSSFFDAPPRYPEVHRVATLLRDEVTSVRPKKGEHLLVYLNRGEHQLTPRVEEALQNAGAPVVFYGSPRRGVDGNIIFRAPGNRSFVEDLSRAIGVVSTAGNQLVGECIYFGKPMLVMPESVLEQRMNATALVNMGLGAQVPHEDFGVGELKRFFERLPDYRENMKSVVCDGRPEVLATLDRFSKELTGHRANFVPSRSFAPAVVGHA